MTIQNKMYATLSFRIATTNKNYLHWYKFFRSVKYFIRESESLRDLGQLNLNYFRSLNTKLLLLLTTTWKMGSVIHWSGYQTLHIQWIVLSSRYLYFSLKTLIARHQPAGMKSFIWLWLYLEYLNFLSGILLLLNL